jgi:guanosine-3',5'-bis(diphosphate) 3'-pyrophosphohydrolase
VEIEVNAFDRPNLATDIMTTIADTKTIINAVHARGMKNRMARVNLKIEIRNVEHLYRVMQKVNQVSDVLEVHRVVPN